MSDDTFRSPLLAGDVRWFQQMEALGATMCGVISDPHAILPVMGLLVAAQGAALTMGSTLLTETQVIYAVAPGADPKQVALAAKALVAAGVWLKTATGYDLGVGPLLAQREKQANKRKATAREGGLAKAEAMRTPGSEGNTPTADSAKGGAH